MLLKLITIFLNYACLKIKTKCLICQHFYRFIGGLFPLVNRLPSNELRKNLCRVGMSSKLRLNFYQGFIIRIWLALLVFVLIKVNKCLYMSMFQMVLWRIASQVLPSNASPPLYEFWYCLTLHVGYFIKKKYHGTLLFIILVKL